MAAASPAKPAGTAEDVKEPGAAPNDTGHQGIKVHGHWLIDIRNTDGSLAEHRDFENSLVDNGFNLAGLLAGTMTAGEPIISLTNALVTTTFCGFPQCILSEFANGAFKSLYQTACGTTMGCSPTLIPTVTTTGTGGSTVYSLQLSAQTTATQAGTIATVSTVFSNCATQGATVSQVPPSTCAAYSNLPAGTIIPGNAIGGIPSFTSTTQSPISVSAGQQVQVTVILSFS